MRIIIENYVLGFKADMVEPSNINMEVRVAEQLQKFQTTPQGLTDEEARQRLERYGPNLLKPKKKSNTLVLLSAQFKSPIILILIFAAVLAGFLEDYVNTLIILGIVIVSGLLGFWQERGASNAVEKLLAMVQIKATAIRNGISKEISVEDIVPGDIVILKAGDTIPGDCLILESKDAFVNEAALTGETYPVEKTVGVLQAATIAEHRTDALFMGTHMVSGNAKAVVVHTGKKTEFGKISERLRLKQPETEFERGVRRFGYFLMEITLVLVIAILAINAYFARPVLDSLLFSLALAVGLTPQLLPAIISINLSHGAKRMALGKVIVKRLITIENLGSMNVLCSDKTGTLTEGVMRVHSTLNLEGNENEKVLLYAYLNAIYETGFTNPIDEAIRSHHRFDVSDCKKLDEVPFDFIRKRISILLAKGSTHLMVTKGALQNILAICSSAETSKGIVNIEIIREQIQQRFQEFSNNGFRVLGIAYRDVGSELLITKDHEIDMIFLGFIILFDPPKVGIANVIKQLKKAEVLLKIVTGDNEHVAAYIGKHVGLSNPQILTGSDLRNIDNEALLKLVNDVDVFAEVEPNQKERIILALKKSGNVVGYIGDGINDAPSLHAADVGISVDSAVDVAKEAAEIVLLEKHLDVLLQGLLEGRRTFINTLKYVFMATSANFGNMFSMAGASLFLSFLPLLPKQILLTNLMTDFPEMTIATDNVDNEAVEKPRRWNIKFIRKFMMTFGILSSVFDYLTFGVLLFILNSTTEQFRTGWFMESVISASLIVLIIRSRKPFFKSKPGKYLLMTTLLIVGITLIFPFTPLAVPFGFTPMPISFVIVIGMIVFLYIIGAEMIKRAFYKKVKV